MPSITLTLSLLLAGSYIKLLTLSLLLAGSYLINSFYSSTADEDYIAVNTPLTFTWDETSFNVTVEILGDEVVEGDEVVIAQLVVPQGESGVTLKSSHLEINIIDDDSMFNV